MIRYTSGYKYQLAVNYSAVLSLQPSVDIDTDFISLSTYGRLTIRKGYAWDGPSGPTIDTANFMRGSLIHDALYQLMRMGLLSQSRRAAADEELRGACRADGMSAIRAWWIIKGLKWGGAAAASPKNRKKVRIAP